MGSLYELKAEYRAVYEEDDLDVDSWFGMLEEIQGDIEDKADAYAKIIKNYEAEALKFKAEAKRLADVQKVYENKAKRLKERLYNAMNELNMAEIPNNLFKIKIQANGGIQPLIIKEGVEIPKEYQIVSYTLDNDKIREALKQGELEFASLGERGTHLVIR